MKELRGSSVNSLQRIVTVENAKLSINWGDVLLFLVFVYGFVLACVDYLH